ncbi:MAG TPA: flagellar hook capping FlgD N-terminal domain-containing protein [Phycisphaerales bacterium]|nr:flagellar hook capping FlgD N-terminal domain-containing protein [Phycisphaerales bacterium]
MASAVDTLGGTSSGSPSAASAFSSMKSEDFLQLILMELTKQDPMQPNDTQALLDQLSTVYNIQSQMDLSTRMGDIVDRDELASASSMIGRYITGISEDITRVEGTVAAVTKTKDGSVLVLEDGTRVPMKDVDGVIDALPEVTS